MKTHFLKKLITVITENTVTSEINLANTKTSFADINKNLLNQLFYKFFQTGILVFIGIMGDSTQATASLLTYNFEGFFLEVEGNLLFNENDTFTGSYTFDPTVIPGPDPDDSLDIRATVINDDLIGTEWSLNVNSSTDIGNFTVSGTSGQVAVGDNTIRGDRYIATLFSSQNLPNEFSLNFFQIAMFQSLSDGSDLLSNGTLEVFPQISSVNAITGRFFITPGENTEGCTQCQLRITSFTTNSQSIPEPSTIVGLMTTFGLGVFFKKR